MSSLEAYLHDLYKVDNKIQVQYKILLYENKLEKTNSTPPTPS